MKRHIVDVNRKCNRYHNTSPLSSSLYPIILCASPSMPGQALQQKFNNNNRKQWSSYLSYISFGVFMLERSPGRPKQQGLRRSSCFTTSQNGLANLKTHSFFWVCSTSWGWLATIRWRWQWRCCTYVSFLSTSKPAYIYCPLFMKVTCRLQWMYADFQTNWKVPGVEEPSSKDWWG